MSPKCLHRRFWGRFSNCFSNLAQQICWGKDQSQQQRSYTIDYRASQKKSRCVAHLQRDVSMMSPRPTGAFSPR